MARNAYLAAGRRSPIGAFGGSLKSLRATEIATGTASVLLQSCGVAPWHVQIVIAGMVLQDMTESNPARIVALRLGVPEAVPAYTLNMQCCSGMLALIQAAQQVSQGNGDCALIIGLESMSNAPHMVPGSRWGFRLSDGCFVDSLRECTLAGSKMWGDPWYMIDVAENHAKTDGITRREMDEYAVVSHTRSVRASDAGRFVSEIATIEARDARGKLSRVSADEHPRRDVSYDSLAALLPVRPGGTITAGNAAGLNDGAAVALICSDSGLAKLGLTPLAKIDLSGTALVGCDPRLMGYSCVHALEAALRSAGSSVDKLDLIECNEGFAVQLLACERMGKWPRERLNVDGGSIGLGHPVGMSGARIAIHLAHALQQRRLRWGAATVPAGSGLGAAVLLERCG